MKISDYIYSKPIKFYSVELVNLEYHFKIESESKKEDSRFVPEANKVKNLNEKQFKGVRTGDLDLYV